MARLLDVFVRFLRVGFTAFGGPIAGWALYASIPGLPAPLRFS
jgi:chromate transport protein ChrA